MNEYDEIHPDDISNEENEGRPEKLAPDDSSLDIIPQAKVNKKTLKLIGMGFAGIVFIAIIIAFSPAGPAAQKKTDEEKERMKAKSPRYLEVSEADYTRVEKKNEGDELLAPSEYEDRKKSVTDSYMDDENDSGLVEKTYAVYDRRNDEREVVVKDKDDERQKSIYRKSGAVHSTTGRDEELERRQSPLFFPVSLPSQVSSSTKKESEGKGEEDLRYAILKEQVEAGSVTDYQKQNMQKAKMDWIEGRERDFSSYLESVYIDPFDVSSEIKAGTVIPITMVTGIQSDLPGDIVAQVICDVYDSITGETLLIPAGSKAVGMYDSSVAFGQTRVLLAWDRIIRPDGVSLNLRGMKGVDLSGASGMQDKVDNHIDELVGSIGASTVFEMTVDAVTAWMSSIDFLSGLVRFSDDKERDPAAEVASAYFGKVLNRQPTIRIRAGMRGNILVSKDMILPPYIEEWGGVM